MRRRKRRRKRKKKREGSNEEPFFITHHSLEISLNIFSSSVFGFMCPAAALLAKVSNWRKVLTKQRNVRVQSIRKEGKRERREGRKGGGGDRECGVERVRERERERERELELELENFIFQGL